MDGPLSDMKTIYVSLYAIIGQSRAFGRVYAKLKSRIKQNENSDNVAGFITNNSDAKRVWFEVVHDLLEQIFKIKVCVRILPGASTSKSSESLGCGFSANQAYPTEQLLSYVTRS